MDLNYALHKYELPALMTTSTQMRLLQVKVGSNLIALSMMFTKYHVMTSIRGSIPECKNVNKLRMATDEQFDSSDMALASTLVGKLSLMKVTDTKSVCENIMQMRDIAAQLESLKLRYPRPFWCISFGTLSLQNMDISKFPITHIR